MKKRYSSYEKRNRTSRVDYGTKKPCFFEPFSNLAALLINLFWVYVCFNLCRILFVILNHSYSPDLTVSHFFEMFRGGFMFDTSAILYINSRYIVLMLWNFH